MNENKNYLRQYELI